MIVSWFVSDPIAFLVLFSRRMLGRPVALGMVAYDTRPTPNDERHGNMDAGRVLPATADGGGDPKLSRVTTSTLRDAAYPLQYFA